MQALDDGGVYIAAAGATDGVTIGGLSDATANASANRYDGAFLYLATGAGAGQQRRVMAGGFTPSTGELLVEVGWTAPTTGDIVEITHMFPIGAGAGTGVSPEDTSYHQIINLALNTLWAPDQISLAFANTTTASLAAFPWLDRPERLVRVLETAPVSGYAEVPCDWRNPQLVLGAAPMLQLNRPYTGTLILEVRRPGGTSVDGAESTLGLFTESQTALPSVEDVREAGLMHVYRALMNRGTGRPNGDWAKRYADQRERVEKLRYYDRTAEMPAAPAAPAAEVA
jgi:hypothetical protein